MNDWMLTPEEIEEAFAKSHPGAVIYCGHRQAVDVALAEALRRAQDSTMSFTWSVVETPTGLRHPDVRMPKDIRMCVSCGAKTDPYGNLPCGH
jgi:hypothetical protein